MHWSYVFLALTDRFEENLEQLKHGADICDCETVATLNIDFFLNFI